MQGRTIAAISTPFGRGGIAVVRISGENALEIAGRAFKCSSGKSLSGVGHGRAVYGNIVSPTGKVVDDGLATVFHGPRSFTGEDTVEVSCHGGILITQRVLECFLKAGAVYAEPGEFTKRAFISGKLGLTEAEAVIATINAESDEQLKLARSHMDGALSREINDICDELIRVLSRCYVLCDYPDEDLSEVSGEEVCTILKGAFERLRRLDEGYRVGHAVAEGISTAIVGQPNVGKSSLLNGLLGYDRAIVTDIPGTTRDTVEEKLLVGRVLLKLCDTAGIRSSEEIDSVERIGIERSIKKLEHSELVFAVFDGSDSLDGEDMSLLHRLKDYTGAKIAILNKTDIGENEDTVRVISSWGFDRVILVSAKDGKGIDEIKAAVESLYFEGEIDYTATPILSLARQKVSVENAMECISRALRALEMMLPADIAGLDVEGAIAALHELDGRQISEKIVSGIFSSFCVGK